MPQSTHPEWVAASAAASAGPVEDERIEDAAAASDSGSIEMHDDELHVFGRGDLNVWDGVRCSAPLAWVEAPLAPVWTATVWCMLVDAHGAGRALPQDSPGTHPGFPQDSLSTPPALPHHSPWIHCLVKGNSLVKGVAE